MCRTDNDQLVVRRYPYSSDLQDIKILFEFHSQVLSYDKPHEF